MYLRYYGLDDYPFSVTPDPAFLYLSASHREALGHLLYGAGEHGGFVALIGEVGTGKTTLIRALVDNDMPDLDVALCWNPQLEVREFVATVCDELGVAYDPRQDTSLKALVDRLNAHLLESHANNRRTVLIIDEAQNLSRGVLEQLRLLTNLETHKHKLLRIILVGQPELNTLLARNDLRQLAQRITARFTLTPLGLHETREYVQHRLKLAGGSQHLFTGNALRLLRVLTGGVPRLINMVCERALMGGYANGKARIGMGVLARAARETLPRRRRPGWMPVLVPAVGVALLAIVGVLVWYPGVELTRAAEWIPSTESAEAPNGQSAAIDPGRSLKLSGEGGDSYARSALDLSDDSATRAAVAGPEMTGTPSEAPLPDGDADLTQLLRLWGVFGSEVRSGCASLRVGDLRCVADRGGFDVLERFNRPALLTIRDDGRQRKVLLSSLDESGATLVGSDGTRQISRARLGQLWTGAYEIVWRSDSGVTLIQPGAVGSAVVWLRERLDRIDGRNPEARVGSPSSIYDDALERRLRTFQRDSGLKSDGIAGPRTQMMLNGSVPSPGSPALDPVES